MASTGVKLARFELINPTRIDGTIVADSDGYEIGFEVPKISSDSFTRPSNTTQYSALDLVANSVTAGSVVPLTFLNCAKSNDRPLMVRRATILLAGTTTITSSTFNLHLFNVIPTFVTNGDNDPISTNVATGVAGYVGTLVNTNACVAVADGIFGQMIPVVGSEINCVPVSGAKTLYGVLTTVSTYTPISAGVITVNLECRQF